MPALLFCLLKQYDMYSIMECPQFLDEKFFNSGHEKNTDQHSFFVFFFWSLLCFFFKLEDNHFTILYALF